MYLFMYVRIYLLLTVCVFLKCSRPDVTFSVDWALKTNSLSILTNNGGQVKSGQFMFSNPLGVTTKEKTKQTKNQENHALKNVAISQ